MPKSSPRLLDISIKEAKPSPHTRYKSHDHQRMRVKPKARKSSKSHRTSSHRTTKRPSHTTKHATTSTTRRATHTTRRTLAQPARNSAVIGIARASAQVPVATDDSQTSDDAAPTATGVLGVAESQAADSDDAPSTPAAGPSRSAASPQQQPQAVATSTAADAAETLNDLSQSSDASALSTATSSTTQSPSQTSSTASYAQPVIGIAASVHECCQALTMAEHPPPAHRPLQSSLPSSDQHLEPRHWASSYSSSASDGSEDEMQGLSSPCNPIATCSVNRHQWVNGRIGLRLSSRSSGPISALRIATRQ